MGVLSYLLGFPKPIYPLMSLQAFLPKVSDKTAVLGVMGLGYVGLPLVVEMAKVGYKVIGYDISEAAVSGINSGVSHIQDVSSDELKPLVENGLIEATTDPTRLDECDTISICVPTPLNKIKDPDLSYVISAGETIKKVLRSGQLVILESTTYPGTTDEVLQPILETTGLKAGQNFFLCYSPERVDPGNPVWQTKNTPKVLGGVTADCTQAGVALYEMIFDTIVPVESARAAELVKVYENTFRMINIALANEIAQACDKLDINVWDVIEAAATKPFGFMKFTPGPGLGGHCIPLDPHYLSWKMRTLAYKTRMIELASEINSEMPTFVVQKTIDALNEEGKALRNSRVLVLGIAYKKDIDDLRESPALEIIELFQEKGADVSYHDPYCPVIRDDGHTNIRHLPMQSTDLTPELLQNSDAVVVVTDHSNVDYALVRNNAKVTIDTRGVMNGINGNGVVIGLAGRELGLIAA